MRRLSWLPPETNELLRLASLLGSAFTLHDVATITGRPVIDVAAWLREASLAGLVVGDGDRLTFRHDLIREAVYGSHAARRTPRPAPCRRPGAGARRRRPPSRSPNSSPGARYPATSRLSPGWSEPHTNRCRSPRPTRSSCSSRRCRSLRRTGRDAPALQARMIDPLDLCGRFDEAEAVATAVLAGSPAEDIEYAALARTAASCTAVVANPRRRLPPCAALQPPAGAPRNESQQLLCIAATVSVMTREMGVEEARLVAEENLARSTADHDTTMQGGAHAALGVTATLSGFCEAGLEHFAAAMALCDEALFPRGFYPITPPDSYYALTLVEVGAIEEARAAAANARMQAERIGALGETPDRLPGRGLRRLLRWKLG